MRKNYKREILKMLSNNLEHFFPELKNHFMCPTCLKKIPLSKTESISEAHIIPKAAGGKFKTLICRKCNSDFGTKQDKWFGEIVRLSQLEKPSIIDTKIKDGYFEIDDIRINGQWERNSDGNFKFQIYKNYNSPQVNALIDEKLKASSPKIRLSLPLPLMKNKQLIDVGFLTAGYLMWFRYLGYSWVLQSHLDPIREQILNPDKEIIKANFIATCNDLDCKPWIGFLPINDDVVLTFGVGPHIVIIPPRNNSNFYSSMGIFTFSLDISDIRAITMPVKPHYGQPAGLIYEDKVLVLPDIIHHKVAESLFIIHFTRQSSKGNILHSVSEDKYRAFATAPNVIKKSIKL